MCASQGCPECGTAAGEPHVHPCSFHERHEAAARRALWVAGRPAGYARFGTPSILADSLGPAARLDDARQMRSDAPFF